MNKFSVEIQESAYRLVKDVINVKSGEKVVITADTGSDWNVIEATVNGIRLLNGKPMVIWYPMPPYVGKAADNYLPKEPLEESLKNADVWIEFNKSWLLYSTLWDNVMAEKKVRYVYVLWGWMER